MSIHKFVAVVVAVCALALTVPVAAGAQTLPSGTSTASLARVSVSGVAKNHKTFNGHFAVDRFVARGGKTFAVGTLTGKLGTTHIDRSNIAMPASVATGSPVGAASAAAATCPVLHLVLGPVNLNLLGLVVTLGGGSLANQPIVLDITAVPGSGNLLGNLLCGVSNLLNGTGATTPLTPGLTAGLLNLVNSLLNVPALSSL
jgi:hypothetical protein